MRNMILITALVALAGCSAPDAESAFADPLIAGDSAVGVQRGAGPPDADPSACYGRTSTPALIETVTEQRRVPSSVPDADGLPPGPAVFVSETRQRILRERRDFWFEVPCELESEDADFIASLQRALKARGLYTGPITGTLTRRTAQAVRAFQAPQGLDSEILSRAAAQQLGLALWNPELAGVRTGG